MRVLNRLCHPAMLLSLALSAGLTACEEIDLLPIEIPSGGDEDRPRKNDCFHSMMYLVEGDTFTGLGGSIESFDIRGTTFDETAYGWNPRVEPRAKCRADLDRVRGEYEGFARLYWNDELVQEAQLDHAFALGSEPVILVHVAEDGTRVELHAFAKPECTVNQQKPVMTREEVEALER